MELPRPLRLRSFVQTVTGSTMLMPPLWNGTAKRFPKNWDSRSKIKDYKSMQNALSSVKMEIAHRTFNHD